MGAGNTYEVKVKCRNCGWRGKIEIEKGNAVSIALCPNCECPNQLTLNYSTMTRDVYNERPLS